MDSGALTATQAIQSILAPAVMISSNGLFFLGLNARQGSLYSRIRALNEEKRKIIREINNGVDHDHCDDIRCLSIDHQLNKLLRRSWYVRNSIICCTVAVGLFVLTSFAIGLLFVIDSAAVHGVPLFLFVAGMLLVLSGCIFLGVDELVSYSVIILEVKGKE
jgi:hypothetical protein